MSETDILPGSLLAGHSAGAHVPRTLVHKTADREVLLSAAGPLAGDRFAVWVRWPHDHLLYQRAADGSRDSLVVVETMRQAGIYLSHRFHDVPMDHAFVLHSFDFHLDAPVRDSGDGADVVFDITLCREQGNSRRFRMSSDADILVGGRPVGRAAMRWDALAPRQYAVVRGRGVSDAVHADRTAEDPVGQPLLASDVGRDRSDAVLLTNSPDVNGGWRVRLDTGHASLFDHACDHVPGMVLVEAFRQGALVRASQDAPGGWAVHSMRTSFVAFGEPDLPVTVTAESTGPDAFLLTARQGARTLASAQVTGRTTSPLGMLARRAGAATC
ncbi:ScbA/BarX family gamma-butyrolactone biosynthesis protein [Streptomyces sp. NPDC001514]